MNRSWTRVSQSISRGGKRLRRDGLRYVGSVRYTGREGVTLRYDSNQKMTLIRTLKNLNIETHRGIRSPVETIGIVETLGLKPIEVRSET